MVLLPAATNLGQGNVFTGVCDSVHRGGPASVHDGIPPPQEQTPPGSRHPPGAETPQEQTPPRSRYPHWRRHPPGADPPEVDTPREQTPLGADTTLGADTPPGADTLPPEQTNPPGSRPPLGADTPGSRYPRSRHPPEQKPPPPPPSRLRHIVNERPVSILLECILVSFFRYPIYHANFTISSNRLRNKLH